MSKEWHPDKHKGEKDAETKFKAINEAYEVLGNLDKKQSYDQFGTTGGPGSRGANGSNNANGGFDFNNFDFSSFGNASDFGDIFGSFFGGGGRQQQAQPQSDGHNREIELTINFMDVVKGIQVPIQLRRLVVCDACTGNGAEPGTDIATCPTCSGTGQVTQNVQSFFGQIQRRGICGTCEGSGKVPKTPCKKCDGEGRIAETSDLTIDVPAGIESGQGLRIRGQGDAGRQGAPTGDLFVQIRVRPDPRFERDGADVRSEISVPVIDAILGGEAEVETVQGSSTVQIPDGMQPGQTFRLRGKGFPVLSSSRHGDHYVTVNIEIPKKLSRAERKILEEWREMKN